MKSGSMKAESGNPRRPATAFPWFAVSTFRFPLSAFLERLPFSRSLSSSCGPHPVLPTPHPSLLDRRRRQPRLCPRRSFDAAFLQTQPGLALTTATGASGDLVAQIRNGAPFDVFLSADPRLPPTPDQGGRGDPASLTTFAIGRLVLWKFSTRPGPSIWPRSKIPCAARTSRSSPSPIRISPPTGALAAGSARKTRADGRSPPQARQSAKTSARPRSSSKPEMPKPVLSPYSLLSFRPN